MLIKRKLRQNSTLTLRLITGNWLLFASLLIDMYMYAVVCSVRGTSCTIDVGCFTLNVKQRPAVVRNLHINVANPWTVSHTLSDYGLSLWNSLDLMNNPCPIPIGSSTPFKFKSRQSYNKRQRKGSMFSWDWKVSWFFVKPAKHHSSYVSFLISIFVHTKPIQNPVYMHHIYHL